MKKDRPTIKRRDQNQPAISKSGRIKLYSLMFVVLMALVSGVFFAARQHFAFIDYSMRNSKLRKQLEDLEAEKRRLLLAREVSLSPAEIKKAAKRLGVTDVEPGTLQLASASKDARPALPQTIGSAKTADTAPSLVVRTAYIASSAKPINAEQVRPSTSTKKKPGSVQIAAVVATR